MGHKGFVCVCSAIAYTIDFPTLSYRLKVGWLLLGDGGGAGEAREALVCGVYRRRGSGRRFETHRRVEWKRTMDREFVRLYSAEG